MPGPAGPPAPSGSGAPSTTYSNADTRSYAVTSALLPFFKTRIPVKAGNTVTVNFTAQLYNVNNPNASSVQPCFAVIELQVGGASILMNIVSVPVNHYSLGTGTGAVAASVDDPGLDVTLRSYSSCTTGLQTTGANVTITVGEGRLVPAMNLL